MTTSQVWLYKYPCRSLKRKQEYDRVNKEMGKKKQREERTILCKMSTELPSN